MFNKAWVVRGGLDERGVALPVALFGLLAVSVLVTSTLVTPGGTVKVCGLPVRANDWVIVAADAGVSPALVVHHFGEMVWLLSRLRRSPTCRSHRES